MIACKPLPFVLLFIVVMPCTPLLSMAQTDPPSSQGLAQQVNELQALVSSLQANVSMLQSKVSTLEGENSTLQTQVSTLQSQVGFLQAPPASFVAIAPYISLETVNGHPTVRFTGVNVQIVNGRGGTFTVNGLGNLIIGYDESRTSGPSSCSLGVFVDNTPLQDQASCESHGFTWALNHKTGSHYLVMGRASNYSQAGGIVAGEENTSNNLHASVIGGFNNTAAGVSSFIAGGQGNLTLGNSGLVTGGDANVASGGRASVLGGKFNNANGSDSSISGGSGNTASGDAGSVSGGGSNSASGIASSISGGVNNVASGNFSSILGGLERNATSEFQVIPP